MRGNSLAKVVTLRRLTGTRQRGGKATGAPCDCQTEQATGNHQMTANSLALDAGLALLDAAGLDHRALERVLHALSGPQIDLADLYFERSRAESWSLEDGIVKEGAFGIDQGVGLRAVSGEKTGFAYADDFAL